MLVRRAFLDERRARGMLLPTRRAHRFPQLDVAEALEEGEAPRGAEFLGIRQVPGAALLSEQLGEHLGELVPARKALVTSFAERAQHDVVERCRHRAAHLRRQARRAVEDIVDQLVGGAPVERPVARHQVIEHAAEGEHVGAEVDLLALQLLGRHVRGGAHARHLGHVAPRELRRAEIRHLDVELARIHSPGEDVGGLHVAMHDAERVGEFERLAALVADLHRDHGIEQRRGLAVLGERRPVDHFHHQVAHRIAAADVFEPGVEDADDVRVAQLSGERRFVLEEAQLLARFLRIVGQLLQDLDRDFALPERIDGQVDRAGRALAKQLLHFVFADVREH